jgi:hypothetical protein
VYVWFANGADLCLCVLCCGCFAQPLLAQKLLDGSMAVAPNPHVSLGLGAALDRELGPGLNNLWHVRQLRLLAAGQPHNPRLNPWWDLCVMAPQHYVVDPKAHPTAVRVAALVWMALGLWLLWHRLQWWITR